MRCKSFQQQEAFSGRVMHDTTALQIPERILRMVSADFITGLPMTKRGDVVVTTLVPLL